MTTLVAVSGSLRDASFNEKLARAAEDLAPAGVSVEVETIRGIPLYNGDVESRDGLPEAVRRLQDRIAESHGLLIVSPEYNHSLPGVFKNAIDWLSRPPAEQPRVFHGRAVAVIGATPGPGGTRLAQAAWLPVFRALGMRPWFGRQLYVAGAGALFDETGRLTDEPMRERLAAFVSGFAEFAARH